MSVLPDSSIRLMIGDGSIRKGAANGIKREYNWSDQVQPASLDLTLGDVVYCVGASFLPGSSSMTTELDSRTLYHSSIGPRGVVLDRNKSYIVPLQEELELPNNVCAFANPKSSTGRIDVFARLITENGTRFDQVPFAYKGRLYLEVCPRSFPVRVYPGTSLNQLRFVLNRQEFVDDRHLILDRHRLVNPSESTMISDGLELTVDLEGFLAKGIIGYRAKNYTPVLDVHQKHRIEDFWYPIHGDRHERTLLLEPDAFYILMSKENIAIPSEYAGELVPMDYSLGEFRVHYAGFFDPGFGVSKSGPSSRAVLEVRVRDVPFILYHEQAVARMRYERMSLPSTNMYGEVGNSYQAQGLRLAKYFD